MLTKEELEQLQTVLMHDKTLYSKVLVLLRKHAKLLEKYGELRTDYNELIKGVQKHINEVQEYVAEEYAKKEHEEMEGD